METTLVLNAGSSSVKFQLSCETVLLEGVIDRIGDGATLEYTGNGIQSIPCTSHKEAGLYILSLLDSLPDRVLHRVVHGGNRARPTRIDREVLRELHDLVPLAPLHLPGALALIELFSERTDARQIACFDTMFHRTMPVHARTYALPVDLAYKHRIERYGFHGIAHEALLHAAAAMIDKPASRCTIITCQLGNGASVCAIRNGKSIDTTMGFTPLEGLVMGTRSGSIDPAIIPFLCTHERLSPDAVLDILENESGLLGLTGSRDVRDLLERKDAQSQLALDLFAYRVRSALCMYAGLLGRIDAVVFGGGVSRSPVMRAKICEGLGHLGISVKSAATAPRAKVSSGSVPVFVVDVDEQAEMLRSCTGL